MRVNNQYYRSLWMKKDNSSILCVIDQRFLPHEFIIEELETCSKIIRAISAMHIRGAGLIGAVASYGIYFAFKESKMNITKFNHLVDQLKMTRPTAVNLFWAIKKQIDLISWNDSFEKNLEVLLENADRITDDDAYCCQEIGRHGISIIRKIYQKTKNTVNILTHCNAGWLAFVDFGSATSAIYQAHREKIPIHVWVDETRPLNQGARLTAWELLNEGVAHTIIADNTGGYLMQTGQVDMVITGCDRISSNGDVANKIGTYLKALAAFDNNIPFYVALPYSTIDWNISDGVKNITIEKRSGDEIKYIEGLVQRDGKDVIEKVLLTPKESPTLNYGFDVTPARLITKIITERGICDATGEGLLSLYK